jgi:hypothetical protein
MTKILYSDFLAKLTGQPETPSADQAIPKSADRSNLPDQDQSPLATKLEAISEHAIDKLDEILSLPLDPSDSQFAGLLRAQNSAATTALLTQVRVDDFRLRVQQTDMLPRILAIMERERAKLPKLSPDHGDGGGDGP